MQGFGAAAAAAAAAHVGPHGLDVPSIAHQLDAALQAASCPQDKLALLQDALQLLHTLCTSSSTPGKPMVLEVKARAFDLRQHHVSDSSGGVYDRAAMQLSRELVRLAAKHGVAEQYHDLMATTGAGEERGSTTQGGLAADGSCQNVGSGPGLKPLDCVYCANQDPRNHFMCQNAGTLVCSTCQLVAYCSKECQQAHRARHLQDCKSELASPNWKPRWMRQGRQPSWINNGPMYAPTRPNAPREQLWGDLPAYNLLPSFRCSTAVAAAAGGGSVSGDGSGAAAAPRVIRLCLPACGDLRHVISTIAGLHDTLCPSNTATSTGKTPSSNSSNNNDDGGAGSGSMAEARPLPGGPASPQLDLEIHLNDFNPKVMARNIAMLLLLGRLGQAGIDCFIQLWYSSALTAEQWTATLRALDMSLGLKAGSKGDGLVLPAEAPRISSTAAAASWLQASTAHGTHSGSSSSSSSSSGSTASTPFQLMQALEHAYRQRQQVAFPLPAFPGSSICLSSPCTKIWEMLAAQVAMPLDVQTAADLRGQAIHDPAAADKVDRHMHCMRPFHRVGWHHFRDFGVMLPFGCMDAQHNTANKMLLDPTFGWTLGDGCDPLNGWPIMDVLASGKAHGVPASDLYGALHFHLSDLLQRCVAVLASGQVRVSFHISCQDARTLASSYMAAGHPGFDVVDVSNISDEHYVGVCQVLKDWGPLLRPEPTTTVAGPGGSGSTSTSTSTTKSKLITSFMNWAASVPGMVDSGLTQQELEVFVRGQAAAARRSGRLGKEGQEMQEALSSGNLSNVIASAYIYTAKLDSYLQDRGAYSTAALLGLQRVKGHTIVPHRIGVPVGAPISLTPAKSWRSQEEKYCHTKLTTHTYMELFVEWQLKDGPSTTSRATSNSRSAGSGGRAPGTGSSSSSRAGLAAADTSLLEALFGVHLGVPVEAGAGGDGSSSEEEDDGEDVEGGGPGGQGATATKPKSGNKKKKKKGKKGSKRK